MTTVHLTTDLSQDRVAAADGPQRLYVLAEISPTDATRQVQLPVGTVLVLDSSGSMAERQGDGGQGTKIECLRDAASRLIDGLGPNDAVGVVAFTNTVHVAAPLRALGTTDARGSVEASIRRLNAAGGTRIGPAIDAALDALAGSTGAHRSPRIVLLTDGQTMKEEECLAAADRAGQEGVPITVLGLGAKWNENLLKAVGSRSGGYAKYIMQAEDILGHFQGAVRMAKSSVIADASLVVRTVDGVRVSAVWRIVPLIDQLPITVPDGRTVTVPLGAMSGELGQVVLAELDLAAHRPGDYRIAQVEVMLDAPALGVAGERHKAEVIVTMLPAGTVPSVPNPRVMNRLEQLRAWHAQTRALQEMEVGHVDNATRLLDQARTALLHVGDAAQAGALQTEIESLRQRGRLTEAGSKTIAIDANQTQELRRLLDGPPSASPPAPDRPRPDGGAR